MGHFFWGTLYYIYGNLIYYILWPFSIALKLNSMFVSILKFNSMNGHFALLTFFCLFLTTFFICLLMQRFRKNAGWRFLAFIQIQYVCLGPFLYLVLSIGILYIAGLISWSLKIKFSLAYLTKHHHHRHNDYMKRGGSHYHCYPSFCLAAQTSSIRSVSRAITIKYHHILPNITIYCQISPYIIKYHHILPNITIYCSDRFNWKMDFRPWLNIAILLIESPMSVGPS